MTADQYPQESIIPGRLCGLMHTYLVICHVSAKESLDGSDPFLLLLIYIMAV